MTPSSPSEVADEIRTLSEQRFRWAADGQIDRFAELLDDNLAFVHLTGKMSSNAEWIAELHAGAYGYREMEFVDWGSLVGALNRAGSASHARTSTHACRRASAGNSQPAQSAGRDQRQRSRGLVGVRVPRRGQLSAERCHADGSVLLLGGALGLLGHERLAVLRLEPWRLRVATAAQMAAGAALAWRRPSIHSIAPPVSRSPARRRSA